MFAGYVLRNAVFYIVSLIRLKDPKVKVLQIQIIAHFLFLGPTMFGYILDRW